MSSKTPVVRQMVWISIIPQLLVMWLIMLIWYQFDQVNYIMFGAIVFLIFSQSLKLIITRKHQKGMIKIKKGAFEAAIPHFQQSYSFFKKNEWVDKYRSFTLFSSGKMPYREMALNNIAFCYAQIGNSQQSKAFYKKTLEEFPDSTIAKTGLNFLNSMTPKNN